MPDSSALADIAEGLFFRGDIAGARLMVTRDTLPFLLIRAKIDAHLVFLDGASPAAARSSATLALETAHESDAPRAEIDALLSFGLADYYTQIGRAAPEYASARGRFADALSLALIHGTPRQLSAAYFHTGLVSQMTGSHEDAEADFGLAYDIARENGDLREQAYAIRHLGFCQRMRGEYKNALDSFFESLILREQINFRLYLPLSHLAIADTLTLSGDLTAALERFEHSEALAAEIGLSRSIALVALAFAEYLAATGNTIAARDRFIRAAEYGRKANHESVVRQADARLGEL